MAVPPADGVAPAPARLPRRDGDCARRLGRQPADGVEGGFAVVLNCIDGRVQRSLADWVREQYDVEYADTVTEPGIDAVLALGDPSALEALLDKVCISRLAHLACYLVVAGHHDCAANPVPRSVHEEHIRTAVGHLRTALPGFHVDGVFLDETWTPHLIEGDSVMRDDHEPC